MRSMWCKSAGEIMEGEEIRRMRLPRGKEILGIVTGLMGGSRMLVMCVDGKERMCRIPGKMRKRVWVKEGNAVLIIPWEIEKDEKADIVWRYRPLDTKWLKEKGYLSIKE